VNLHDLTILQVAHFCSVAGLVGIAFERLELFGGRLDGVPLAVKLPGGVFPADDDIVGQVELDILSRFRYANALGHDWGWHGNQNDGQDKHTSGQNRSAKHGSDS
jgi:hypothetical protein